jgi:hypothetical protein
MSPDQGAPDFQRQQLAFTAHVRDPDKKPVPAGIPARRMGIYSELMFNNINEQLSGNFPVLRSITGDEQWLGMVRDFMVRHRSTTPLFTEIGLEFIAYLQDERETHPRDWPFMLELAHYEYVELAVAISAADRGLADYDPNGDLLAGRPLVAPTAWNLSYQWPVHMIGPDYLPDEAPAGPTHLVVYRDRQDLVHFLEINGVTQRLLLLLKEDPSATGLDVVKRIGEELSHPDPAALQAAGLTLLEDLRRRNVILGTRT